MKMKKNTSLQTIFGGHLRVSTENISIHDLPREEANKASPLTKSQYYQQDPAATSPINIRSAFARTPVQSDSIASEITDNYRSRPSRNQSPLNLQSHHSEIVPDGETGGWSAKFARSRYGSWHRGIDRYSQEHSTSNTNYSSINGNLNGSARLLDEFLQTSSSQFHR